MPGLARVGDQLACGDVIATGSGNVFINGLPAARLQSDSTSGHCHVPTLLYRDASRSDNNIRINGVEAAVRGDWNVPAAAQPPPTFPSSTGGGPCGIACGSTCHDSQIVATSPDVGGSGCC